MIKAHTKTVSTTRITTKTITATTITTTSTIINTILARGNRNEAKRNEKYKRKKKQCDACRRGAQQRRHSAVHSAARGGLLRCAAHAVKGSQCRVFGRRTAAEVRSSHFFASPSFALSPLSLFPSFSSSRVSCAI